MHELRTQRICYPVQDRVCAVAAVSLAMADVIQVLPLPLAAVHVLGIVAPHMGDDALDPGIVVQVLPDDGGGLTPASMIHIRGPSAEACFLRRVRSNVYTMVFVSVCLGSKWHHGMVTITVWLCLVS